MQQKLIDGNSEQADLILEVLESSRKSGTDVNVDQEDVLITMFVDLLIMPFLENIDNIIPWSTATIILYVNRIRKAAWAKKHGFNTKGVRGRAPDRNIELDVAGRGYSVMLMEVKTTKNAANHPDFVKLATLMKDVFDHATEKGAINYFVTGILIAGPKCKVYRLHMPIKKLYCMTEVSSFALPNNFNDAHIAEKLENIIISMLQCRSMVDQTILRVQQLESSNASAITDTVESHPSPKHHYSYFK